MIWFAWYPVKTTNGGWQWLCHVDRQWDHDLNPWCDASGHADSDGGWRYHRIRP
jgi:hypothetical protein